MRPQTLLLRQIHPAFVQQGRVSSQSFRPTPKDRNMLSVYDGDRISAAESWHHFVRQPACRSCGVMAVTNAECTSLNIAILADGVPFPEHASLDFSHWTKSEVEKKSKQLSAFARSRGWVYQAPAA